MALGRILEVQVGPADVINMVAKTEATIISGLDLSFNVVRSNRPSNNKANFTIYNAQKDTQKRVLREGHNILVYAGYEDEGNKSLIYAGNIEETHTDPNGPDIVTTLKATTFRGKDKNSDSINIQLSFEPGKTMKDVLTELSVIMGFALRGGANADLVTLPNGFHYIGTVDGCLRKCYQILGASQLSITKDNTDMFVFRTGYVYSDDETLTVIEPTAQEGAISGLYGPGTIPPQRSEAGTLGTITTPVLSFDGSLISIEPTSKSKQWVSQMHKNTTTKKKLIANTLLDPRLAPNVGVIFDTQDNFGKYVINQVNHYGSNYDSAFNSKIEVQSLD
jgi:hypothetical protein